MSAQVLMLTLIWGVACNPPAEHPIAQPEQRDTVPGSGPITSPSQLASGSSVYPAGGSADAIGRVETMAECRSSAIQDIANIHAGFVTCGPPAMDIALAIFDGGSSDGVFVAALMSGAETMMCVCVDGQCTTDQQQNALRRIDRILNVERLKIETDGANRIIDQFSSNRCLRVESAVRLQKLGYNCGLTTALKGHALFAQRLSVFIELEHGDRDKAMARALACNEKWNKW